ncbi:MAG TPA: flagellar biosynthesis protein FlgC [Spirochaetaceae bacterium]|jgi:flagellar basal-body rod protein FlgG|nr:flagellar biosynthesis protein FlgC [Spirochaetaceae bacterium]
MLRGWYTGASGMAAQQVRLDTVANNLANVDTDGYKREVAVSKAFAQLLLRRMNDDGVYLHSFGSGDMAPVIGKLGTGVESNEIFTELEQGALKITESDFDIALDGKGWLSVQTPYGERYTRNGSFILGKEGYLETKEGYPLLGENGPIMVKANNFQIDKQGRVWINAEYADDPEQLIGREQNEWKDPVLLDTLKVVDFELDRFIAKQGSSLWKDTELSGPARIMQSQDRPVVMQGFTEASNVNVVSEMVKMIEVNRAYEANQKTIQSQDSSLGKLINEVVRL